MGIHRHIYLEWAPLLTRRLQERSAANIGNDRNSTFANFGSRQGKTFFLAVVIVFAVPVPPACAFVRPAGSGACCQGELKRPRRWPGSGLHAGSHTPIRPPHSSTPLFPRWLNYASFQTFAQTKRVYLLGRSSFCPSAPHGFVS